MSIVTTDVTPSDETNGAFLSQTEHNSILTNKSYHLDHFQKRPT